MSEVCDIVSSHNYYKYGFVDELLILIDWNFCYSYLLIYYFNSFISLIYVSISDLF